MSARYDDGDGPWGQAPGGEPPPRRPGSSPDILDAILRATRNGRNIVLFFLAAVVLWVFSGVYFVDTDEQGVVLRYGKWVRTTEPGLHFHLPYPIETVLLPKVTKVNRVEIGYRGEESTNAPVSRQIAEESLMLTGDENIVDINFAVLWRISDAGKFLFNIRNPVHTIKSVAESVMREVTGQNPIEFVLTEGRDVIQQRTLEGVQKLLDDYGAGVTVTQIQLKKVDPPEQVIDSFRDVQRAKADQERLRNEAESYRNDILPRARGEAARIVQEAEGYKQEVVARAEGDGQRFLSVLESYRAGKDITTERIYLETLQEVMSNARKIIVDGEGASSVVPYLPLPEVAARRQGKTP